MLAFQYHSDLKKTTVVVESLSTDATRCTVPENTSLLQDLINSMRNLHQTMKVIFQKACILHPECNFLHRYFRCQIPVEMVDMEVKVKTMQSIHTFRRDRTLQVIKCNPWSTKLHPYPSLIWKMRTYLELEGDLVPSPGPNPKPSHNKPSCYTPIHIQTKQDQPNQAPTQGSGIPQDPKQMSLKKEEKS